MPVPFAGLNTDSVKWAPPGAPCPVILTSTTRLMIRISATVHASATSIRSVPRRAGITVSRVAPMSRTSVTTYGIHWAGLATPMEFSSELKNTAAP